MPWQDAWYQITLIQVLAMWYNVDILKFALKVLPPVLRRNVLFAFMKVLLAPLVELQTAFIQYVRQCNDNIRVNGQVIYIVKAIKDYFLLDNDDVYISELDVSKKLVYFRNSEPYVYISNDINNPTYIYNTTYNAQLRFIVNIPEYLSDRIEEVRSIVEFNKPAGRQFIINVYER